MKQSVFLRRAGALLLALLLCAAAAAPALGTEPGLLNLKQKVNTYTDGMFPDVAEDWYTTYVAAVYELGLMQGDADGSFRPDGSVTLAETAALAARIHRNYHTGSTEFAQGQPWYQVYVDYCLDNGMLTAQIADYNAAAKRSEFAAVLSRAVPASALPAFNDIADGAIPDVPADAENAAEIYQLYRAGILTGGDIYGTFLPGSDIKRSEVAAIVSRIAYASLRREVALAEKPAYPDLAEGARQDDEYFADAAMLGNSLVDGMMLCSGLSKMSFYGKTAHTVYNNRLNELVQRQYGKVYVEFGINEIAGSKDEFIRRYREIVVTIQNAMPEADVYIMAITPVTKARSAEGTFTMQRINDFNAALHALAEELQCWYLDCCTPLCDAEGYLPANYGGWDGSPHLSNEGYLAWAEAIRTHYAQ